MNETESNIKFCIPILQLEEISLMLKAISNPICLKIVCLLHHKNTLLVSEICGSLNINQSLISHHLSNLKLQGILSSKRDGRNIYYFIKFKEVTKLIKYMSDFDLSNFKHS